MSGKDKPGRVSRIIIDVEDRELEEAILARIVEDPKPKPKPAVKPKRKPRAAS